MANKAYALFSPLNWGLGHATRLIPLIRRACEKQFDIGIAAESAQLKLLENEFPDATFFELSNSKIKYSKSKRQFVKIALQAPLFLKNTAKENNDLKAIIRQAKPDIIISDNRYGFRHKDILSVFITHQLAPKLPRSFGFAEKSVSALHRRYISAFDYCLVPDFPGKLNLAGNLSHPKILPRRTYYLGALSRFSLPEKLPRKDIDFTAVISGPEPQRSIFFDIVVSEFKKHKGRKIILSGLPEHKQNDSESDTLVYPHLPAKELQDVLLRSKLVISRAGYSSIMDFFSLRKTAIIVPTPGQTEQEYLAKIHQGKLFIGMRQTDFSIAEAAEKLTALKPDFSLFEKQNESPFDRILAKALKT